MKSKSKLIRLDVRPKLDQANVFLVNYVADDYRFFLKKFLSIISIVPKTLKALIVPLPKGATHVDQFYAKRIQRIIAGMPEHSLMVLFITHESHKQLIKNFYRVLPNKVVPVATRVTMTASLSEGTLLYAWGSATHGKLGIGVSTEAECESVSEFVKEDLTRIKTTFDEPDTYQYFTYCPQPIVAFLGVRIKTVDAGLHHFLAMTT